MSPGLTREEKGQTPRSTSSKAFSVSERSPSEAFVFPTIPGSYLLSSSDKQNRPTTGPKAITPSPRSHLTKPSPRNTTVVPLKQQSRVTSQPTPSTTARGSPYRTSVLDKMFPQIPAMQETLPAVPSQYLPPIQPRALRPSTPKAVAVPVIPAPVAPLVPAAPPIVAEPATNYTPIIPAPAAPVVDLEKLLADLAVPRKSPYPSQKTYDWDGGDFVGFLEALVPSPRTSQPIKQPVTLPAKPVPAKPVTAKPVKAPVKPAASARQPVSITKALERRSVTARMDVERKLQELIKLPVPQAAPPVRRRINMKPPVDTGLRKPLKPLA